jgi:hypothetical protein
MGVSGTINNALNVAADLGETSLNFTGKGLKAGLNVVAPTLLGWIGGRMTGIDPKVGAFQGCLAGLSYTCIVKPGTTYVKQNRGEGPDKIHQNTCDFLTVLAIIGEIAIPILLTKYFGKAILNYGGSLLPQHLQWIVVPSASATYTVFRGFLTNIAPSVTQLSIDYLTEKSDKNRKHV